MSTYTAPREGGADRRSLILETAIDVISQGGLGAFTQPRVAKEAGLRQGNLTYYFPTRHDLLGAVCARIVEVRLAALEDATAGRPLPDRLTRLATVLTDSKQTRLLLALVQTAAEEPAVAAAFAELRAGVRRLIVETLTLVGVAIGDETVELVQTTSTGIAVSALARGGEAYHQQAQRQLSRLISGLRGDGPAAAASSPESASGPA